MKRPDPPPEFLDYRYDEKTASRSSVLTRFIGWCAVLALAASVASFVLRPQEKSFNLLIVLIFFLLFTFYAILKIRKRTIHCGGCKEKMEAVDIPWTQESWQRFQGYELVGGFAGADGNLYTSEKEKKSGFTHFYIHRHIQRWYVCRLCHTLFLQTRYLRETPFSSVSEEEYEAARQSVLSDPRASEKMNAAWQERLGRG